MGEAPDNTARERKMGTYVIVIVLAIILIALFRACGSGAASDAAMHSSTTWPPEVGEQYVLGSAAGDLTCYDSESVLADVEKAIEEKDNEGYTQEGLQHGMMPDSGDTVRVLDYNAFNGHLHVRVRNGRLAGSECWYIAGDRNSGLFAKHLGV